MKLPETRTVVFIRNFRNCVVEMRRENERRYHIPKSRFGGGSTAEWSVTGDRDSRIGIQKLERFRECLASAWKASDRHYHIPKSRHGNVL